LSPGSNSKAYNASYYNLTDSLFSGPDGKLWFAADMRNETGIARISTSGKLGSFIPAQIFGDVILGPNRQVYFPGSDNLSGSDELTRATRSGIVVTQDVPGFNSMLNDSGSYSSGVPPVTAGPDGNLWFTNGPSSIERISGLDTLAGALDYRHRPRQAPDLVTSQSNGGHYWTNVSGSSKPTFAGVARPAADVSLSVQKQGDNQPVSIGKVKASKSDGSWTLKSHVKLSDGNYAVTASQTGDTGPPSVLSSLAPDSSGNLSSALVIDTSRARKGTRGHAGKSL